MIEKYPATLTNGQDLRKENFESTLMKQHIEVMPETGQRDADKNL